MSIIPALLVLSLFAGVGIAGWGIMLQRQSRFQVGSTEPLVVTSEFPTGSMDVTNSNASYTDVLQLSSDDGDIDLVITWVETKTDDDTDLCDNHTDDITYTVYYGDGVSRSPILNGETPTHLLPSGETRDLVVQYNAERWACPGDLEIDFSIVGI